VCVCVCVCVCVSVCVSMIGDDAVGRLRPTFSLVYITNLTN